MSKKGILLVLAIQLIGLMVFSQVQVTNLLVENRIAPTGIDKTAPRLSWQLLSSERNVMQAAYEIRVATDLKSLEKGNNLSWNSGKISAEQSVYVPYVGEELMPATTYFWQVRVWDNKGKRSKWSEPSYWLTGIKEVDNWKAKWIQVGFEEEERRPSPMFRKEFASSKKIKQAVAFITAKGVYEAKINGQRVGDACLAPFWTSYNERLQYQTYDVTDLVKQGSNAVGVTLVGIAAILALRARSTFMEASWPYFFR